MKHHLTYRATVTSCFLGYFTQAVAINLSPLLYVTFRNQFGLTLGQISLLIAINFGTQFLTDALSSLLVGKVGYRSATVGAHIAAALGLCGYAFLPFLLPPYAGLIISVVLCGVGGGLIEVLISPMIEACPTPADEKSAHMSLLHSFYCWGQAAVILLSTLFFFAAGIENWRILPVLWAAVPATGAVLFTLVPIYTLPGDDGKPSYGLLFRSRAFWLLAVMMTCAGAAEMVMSQWASTFAETGLGVNKALGDLAGPCLFAALMGVARLLSAKLSKTIPTHRMMTVSLLLCIVSYLLAAFSGIPALGLAGCALCGFSVGVLWPGTFSTAAATPSLRGGGMTMFALLAFFGDLGCLAGPSVAGKIAEWTGGDLRNAFLFALIFPTVALAANSLLKRKR